MHAPVVMPPGVESAPLADEIDLPHNPSESSSTQLPKESQAAAMARRRSSVSAVTDEVIAAAAAAAAAANVSGNDDGGTAQANHANQAPVASSGSAIAAAERGARAALLLVDVPPLAAATSVSEREGYLRHKLALCSLTFTWDSGGSGANSVALQLGLDEGSPPGGGGEDPIERRGKAVKSAVLTELIQTLDAPDGGAWLVAERALPSLLGMITSNVFRALPSTAEERQAALLRRVRTRAPEGSVPSGALEPVDAFICCPHGAFPRHHSWSPPGHADNMASFPITLPPHPISSCLQAVRAAVVVVRAEAVRVTSPPLLSRAGFTWSWRTSCCCA